MFCPVEAEIDYEIGSRVVESTVNSSVEEEAKYSTIDRFKDIYIYIYIYI